MFCASQNLLAGVYRDASIVDKTSAEYQRRKEDTDALFEHSLQTTRTIAFYLSPLVGQWLAPSHPHLRDDLGTLPTSWQRNGPASITRAWCCFELSRALTLGHHLLVETSAEDRRKLRTILETDATELDRILVRPHAPINGTDR